MRLGLGVGIGLLLLALMVTVWLFRLGRTSTPSIFPSAWVEVAGLDGSFTLTVNVADTDELLTEALLLEIPALKDRGMLLLYPEPVQYALELKNWKIPVSAAFFDPDGIIRRVKLLRPCPTSHCHFNPGLPFKGVLLVDSSYIRWSADVEGYRIRLQTK
ncbi:MAG: DUF192 domain-containing protein [Thermaceae bacterium]|nr:DUF192 domain-containing protein [Thermaceae bacterium]